MKRIYQETQKALQSPEMAARMRTIGAEPMPMSPEEFDAYIREEIALNAKLVKAAGIKPQ